MSAGEIFVGSVAVGIVPSAQGFAERIRAEVVPSANAAGDEWGDIFAERIRAKMRGALRGESGEATIDVGVDSTKARAEIEALKRSAADSGGAAGDSFGGNFIQKIAQHFRGKSIFADAEQAAKDSGDRAGQSFASKFLSRMRGNGNGGLLSGVFSTAAADAAKDAVKAGNAAGDSVSQGLIEALKSNPWVMAGAGAAIALATPLIAQAMAGMLVFGLGAGIAAMAIYGAAHSKQVTDIFHKLAADANKDLETIGQSFIPVVSSILSTADGLLKKLTPVFTAAAKVIAGPFKTFGDTLISTFGSPAVKSSIEAIAGAFGKLLTALTPTLQADVNAVAKGISNVAAAVAKNPGAFAGFITFMVKIAVATLDLIAALTNVASYMEKQWTPMWTKIGGFVKGVWNSIVLTVKTVTMEIIDLVKIFAALFTGNWTALWNAVKGFFTVTWNGIKGIFLPILNWFRNTSDATWNAIYAVIRSVWNAILGFFRAVGAAIESFWNAVWNAVKNTIGSALNWINNTVRTILNAVFNFWKNLWNDVFNFMHGIWNDIGNDVKSSLDFVYNTFNSVMGAVHNAWNNFWGTIKNIASAAWTWVTQNLGKFLSGMQLAFAVAVKGIGSIWNGVKAIAAAPVQFIVNTIYNGGIVKVVDAISGVFGVKALSPISLPKGFARGTGGAPPGWAWVGEEGPELVNMRGGETVLTNSQSMATGLWGHGMGFATGTAPGGDGGKAAPVHHRPGKPGINPAFVPGGDPLAPIVDPVVHLAEKAFDDLKDLTGDALAAGINAIINPLLNKIPGINTGFGQYLKRDITKVEGELVNYIKGISESTGGSGNAGAIAAFAEGFEGHKYVFGGPSNPTNGWDCSSFVNYVLGHFNIGIPGGTWAKLTNNGASHGPTANQYQTWSGGTNKGSQNVNNIAAGDLLTWNTHVGFGAGPNKMFSAYDTASGTIYTPATAGPTGEKLLIRTINAAQGGSGPAGGATGSEMANGRELFAYLLNNVFGGHKIAAAGAIASIWGESTWNPFAAGTGGRGLIGWTPAGSISNADFSGGMRTQEPAIVRFIQTSGDEGVIRQMMGATSVLQAANLWGKGVERYGINDVHSAGLSLATSIMNAYSGGTRGAAPGWAWVGERGPELVRMSGGETVLTHEQSLSALSMNPGRGYWAGTTGTSPMDGTTGATQFGGGDGKGIERKLDQLIKATKNVGGDVASGLNVPGRVAGNRSNFNNRR